MATGYPGTRAENPHYKTAEYRAWSAMKTRCYNVGAPLYKNYGARGIKVCARWHDFTLFLVDIGLRPGPCGRGKGTYSLNRINNNGDYTPKNCHWSTYRAQNNNRRNNRVYTIAGMTKTLTDWALYLDLSKKHLYNWYHRGRPISPYLAQLVKVKWHNDAKRTD